MTEMQDRKMRAVLIRGLRSLIAVLLLTSVSGCYYLQATKGHFALMRERESIQELLRDPQTDARLRERLELVNAARDFSINRLLLPDNKSYRSFAALERDYVLWNLFAAQPDSLEPKTWCYPFVGCLGYRGYFKREKVLKEAEKLESQGFDVAVGGVVAYSTLGKFDDPMLDTMMRWDDAQLVGTLFHELAHQVIYIKDDTMFNESFATAVEELGLERWLQTRVDGDLLNAYAKRKRLGREILQLVEEARDDLDQLYERKPDNWLQRKTMRFETLSADVRALLAENAAGDAHWLVGDINNAHLIPLALYEGYVGAFRALFAQCESEFACFYAETKRLGGLPAEARHHELDQLAQVFLTDLQHH